jgi:protein-S-isoprenylcysteine O-methyltransferase Ste14
MTFYKETEDELTIWSLGFAIITPGFLIRLWATKHIGRRMPWVKKEKKLVKTGPYSLVRNPLYIGNIIIAIGLALFSELIWFIPLTFFYLFTLYHLVARYEEKKLLERWGKEYAVYLGEVPRWIPKLKNLHRATEGGFHWLHALRSEIPSFYVILFSILIFFLKEVISDMG